MLYDIVHFSDYLFAYPVAADKINVRIRVRSNVFSEVKVFFKNLYDHGPEIFEKEMKIILDDGVHALYEATLAVKERHFKYYFELRAGADVFAYTADGIMKNPAPCNYFYYPAVNACDIIAPPAWAEGEIIYQIWIDRFYDGDPLNNPPGVKMWGAPPDRGAYYGGDFAGIIKKLDYLRSLGAKILYLSPLFYSPSYHKYDVADYYKIEEIYGGEEGLKELVDAAHAKGMKIVLDCVFNHCSAENELFRDVIEKGASSPYRDWFYIYDFPVDASRCNYDTFAGAVPEMPRFNTANPEVIAYLTDVARYWTEKLDIDGWRLDVADEVASSFWREFRRKLKAVKPDILIFGEVWNHASKWMQGDQFDTVTNYKYRQWLIEFARGKIDALAFWRKICGNKMLYKTPSFNYLVNLIGSHDTARFRTTVADERIHYLALALTLTFEGMPLIYYGDEVGLEGDEDPDNRRAFPWEATGKEELEFIRAVCRFRESSPALKKGDMTLLAAGPRFLAFKRSHGTDAVVVAVNFGPAPEKFVFDFKEIQIGKLIEVDNCPAIGPYGFIIGS